MRRHEVRYEPSGYGLVWAHVTIDSRTYSGRAWGEKAAYLAALQARDAQEGARG